ncbi:MAG TPA: hypothetical protein VK067_06390 [Pseudogracilibacillus sp.]|nr:hypothetical protein [Pseudogracilibacillus sp.]
MNEKKCIVFVLTLGLLLAACSNSSATENSDGKDVITYWSNFNEEDPNQIVLKNIIADGPDLIDKLAAKLI